MAVKKIWDITHSCGHKASRDLSSRAADRRAGFAGHGHSGDLQQCRLPTGPGSERRGGIQDFRQRAIARQSQGSGDGAVRGQPRGAGRGTVPYGGVRRLRRERDSRIKWLPASLPSG